MKYREILEGLNLSAAIKSLKMEEDLKTLAKKNPGKTGKQLKREIITIASKYIGKSEIKDVHIKDLTQEAIKEFDRIIKKEKISEKLEPNWIIVFKNGKTLDINNEPTNVPSETEYFQTEKEAIKRFNKLKLKGKAEIIEV